MCAKCGGGRSSTGSAGVAGAANPAVAAVKSLMEAKPAIAPSAIAQRVAKVKPIVAKVEAVSVENRLLE